MCYFCFASEDLEKVPEHGPRTRSRALSLGTVFSRNRSKHTVSEHYTTDFWVRNFAEKNHVTWVDFRAAFVLDYKNRLEEFSDTRPWTSVLDAARERLCNKESVVYITRYRKFIGSDSSPDAVWNKIKEEATKILFKEALEDSLCLWVVRRFLCWYSSEIIRWASIDLWSAFEVLKSFMFWQWRRSNSLSF